MEDLVAENVTFPAMEQSADEKHSHDPAEPDFVKAAGISPRQEAPARSTAADVRSHAPKPTGDDEADVSEPAALSAELHLSASLEDEQVPIFETEQAAAEPHTIPHVEEEEVLSSQISFVCVENNGPVCSEGEEASVPEPAAPPSHEYREASSGRAQSGAEPDDGIMKEYFDPDPAHEVDNDEIAGDQVEVAWDEITEEAVESGGEDFEVAGSGDGDVISENEFSMAVDLKRRGGRKRKRGRASSKVQGTRFPSRKKVEEEVCFICFDGGDLVVCDRRGCPKVYHPSCVNREESYFQSKGQWSCGWHICSKCQKSASYMCYTCTYSLCKVCVIEAEFTCIRGKKGFCPSCMDTILLMETSENAEEKKDGVDFNDRSCWEYLFKDYWLELKGKLLMNLDEIMKARTASKVCSVDIANEESSDDGDGASSDRFSACHDDCISSRMKSRLARSTAREISTKEAQIEEMSPPENTSRKRMKKPSSNAILVDGLTKDGETDFSTVHQNPSTIKVKKRSRKNVNVEGTTNDIESEVSIFKKKSSKKKLKRMSRKPAEDNLLKDVDKELTTGHEDDIWASKELLAFVSHVKNGDKSILSQYDVQELLLDYIKVKNLRDRRRRSQIICDKMLLTLFGKSRVGHFEMLKLVESHFLIKVASPTSDDNQGGDADPIETGNEVNDDLSINKRCITRKRAESKQQANFYDYAAIDSYNINLMYLRRFLMEELIDDMNTFSEKVFGSFVRIRVNASSQRQEVYRLVQVVGCGKAPEEYKMGKRTTDVMLEIINLDKKEVITIDIISNQDFTEEECKRLRQSIKFGFISRLTVGEVQEKARVLQAVRVSDSLESEKLRLTHLRDRASEKGKKKEHRECVEKLHLLSTTEEQMKRLNEVPAIHTDPKMDPSYESPDEDVDEDEKKEGNPIQSSFKGRELIFPQKEDSYNWSGFSSQKKEDENINLETQKIEPKAPSIEPLSDSKEPLGESAIQPEPKLETLPPKVDPLSTASENEKLWHYKDPSGKIQGPFSMVQLRKWSKHFPTNLGIWRKSERQEDSIFLTDALSGNFQKDLPEWDPGDIKPTQLVKTSETTSMAVSSLSIYLAQGKQAISNDVDVPTGQSSLGLHQNTAPQNGIAVSNIACTDLVSNFDDKHATGSNAFYTTSRHEQVVADVVNSESTQKASDRPAVIPSETDPSKKLLEQAGTTLGRNILSINVEGYAVQKQDLANPLNSDSCSNHGALKLIDKLIDNSTSSTESDTVSEISPFRPSHTRFRNAGAADVKPTAVSNTLESVSSQRSDASTFPKPAPETLQSAYTNSFAQNSGTSFDTAVRPVNAYDQAPSQNGQPNHVVPQTVGSYNPNLSNDSKMRERSTHLNSNTMPSTSINCQNTPLVSSEGSNPFSSPQLSNSTSAVTFQPSNMSWGTPTPEVNNPGWQLPNQYQNFTNVAAAVGNLLCGSGATNNLGWGMMTPTNMNLNMTTPWGAAPNPNVSWGQGLTFPPQGNQPSNFAWGTPQVNANPFWHPPVQGNTNQNPVFMPPTVVGNMNQNAWGMISNQGNTTWDSSKENPTKSGFQNDKFKDRNIGSRNGDFRGAGSGCGPGQQSRNWTPSGNVEGLSSRPPPPESIGICKFFENGYCKKGSQCNYIHS